MSTDPELLIGAQLLIQGTTTSTTLPQPAVDTAKTLSRCQSLVWRLLSLKIQVQQQDHRVCLLQGPAQSGKTSLLLEAAVDLAGNNRIHNSVSPSLSWCACLSKQHPQCVCATPVILFKRKVIKRQTTTTTTDYDNNGDDNDHGEDFPLFARPASTKDATTNINNNSHNNILNDPNEESWDPMALQRIQVHYYTSWKDLLYALWTLQGLYNQQRPCRAILVDDLVVRDNDNDENGSFSNVWLPQILGAYVWCASDLIHSLLAVLRWRENLLRVVGAHSFCSLSLSPSLFVLIFSCLGRYSQLYGNFGIGRRGRECENSHKDKAFCDIPFCFACHTIGTTSNGRNNQQL